MAIEQPWNDDRLKLNGMYIGCVTKANADYIRGLESALVSIRDMNNADDPSSYRSDDREGCLDTTFDVADRALKGEYR